MLFAIRYSLFAVSALERQELRQRLAIVRDLPALALEIVGDGAAEAGIGDPVGRVGRGRPVAARELVLALRAGLDARQAVGDGPIDRLVVAELEMQERLLLDRAPVAAVERVGADEIERAGDVAAARGVP